MAAFTSINIWGEKKKDDRSISKINIIRYSLWVSTYPFIMIRNNTRRKIYRISFFVRPLFRENELPDNHLFRSVKNVHFFKYLSRIRIVQNTWGKCYKKLHLYFNFNLSFYHILCLNFL